MQSVRYKCDAPGCERVKGNNNHWFRICPHEVMSFGEASLFTIYQWEGVKLSYREELHACGESCLHKIISDLLKGAGTAQGEPSLLGGRD